MVRLAKTVLLRCVVVAAMLLGGARTAAAFQVAYAHAIPITTVCVLVFTLAGILLAKKRLAPNSTVESGVSEYECHGG